MESGSTCLFCSDWKGIPAESEEMAPSWFGIFAIPYEDMWADDAIWLPSVLAGKKVRATFTFGEGDVILSHEFAVVEAEEL